MTKIFIYPYKVGSESARSLSQALNTKCIYPDRNYRPRQDHLVVNWGNSIVPNWYIQTNIEQILNHPLNVAQAVNKLTTLKTLRSAGIPTVKFTEDYDKAYSWLANGECDNIVLRHTLTGHSGEGIEVVNGHYEFEHAPLYTQFIEQAREYRVHVFNGKVFDLQQKKRRVVEGEEYQDGVIKNLANGWVFCREDITEYPNEMEKDCIEAIKTLGLDFGAVDILVKNGRWYILEINTAVGLQGSTLSNYVEQIKNYATR